MSILKHSTIYFIAVIVAVLLNSCDTGNSSGNSVKIGDETFSTGGAFAVWWISTNESGHWSEYEIFLLPCASFDGYDDAEWDFYFDLFFNEAITEIPTGTFRLGEELSLASFSLYSGESYEAIRAADGVLEISSRRSGYYIKFNGTAEDGTNMSATWSGPIELQSM